jgi:retron-type reverse transcriptase
MVLKKCSPSLGKPLATLFKLSFDLGKLPQQWKNANIVPVFKADNKSDPNNYRPISLLCIISKVMEAIINDFLRKHLFNKKLLSSRQYGFQPGKSTMDLLAHATQNWTEALHRGNEVKVIALDISRAFDRVWHKGLLSKLMSIGVGGRLYRWIRGFLILDNKSSPFRSDFFVVKDQCWGPTREYTGSNSVFGLHK